MTWKNDFDTGANSFVTVDDSLLAIQGIGATAVFVWVAWILLKSYQDWAVVRIKGSQMLFIWGRAFFLMMVLLYLLVN